MNGVQIKMWKQFILAYFNVSVISRQSRDGNEEDPKSSVWLSGEFNAELEHSAYISVPEGFNFMEYTPSRYYI
jgi:hypothetical protein